MSEANSSSSPGASTPAPQSSASPQAAAPSQEVKNTQAPVEAVSQSDDGTSEAIDAAAEAGEISQAEAKELKKRLKLKIDGQEYEEEIDFNDDEGLKRHLQKSKAFDKRLKEFTGYKGQVDQFFQQLQQDPEGVLEQLGFNVDEMATKRLQKKVEEMQKSPEQLEKEKMSKELEKLRKESETLKKAQEEAQMESLRNKHAAEVENQIKNALEASKAKLPANNPKVYAMIARTMMEAIDAGYNDVSVSDIIPIVERQWKEEIRSYFDTSTEDLIEELVGKPNLDKLRKKRLAKRGQMKGEAPSKPQIVDTGSPKAKEEPSKKQTMRDFFKNL